jgi:DNA helicase-2/ATP-dependent DNA helicase PcrA
MNNFNELNTAQREAVEATEGPLLVLAGAGAGKTKTITYRILNLIQKGVAPENILAVTFTNKAAKEMQERISKLLESERGYASDMATSGAGRPFVATFHGLGAFIIKENSQEAGVKKHFSIYDREDSKRLVKAGLEKNGYDPKQYEPNKILAIISREKGNFVSANEYFERAGTPSADGFGGIVAKVWQEYEASLRQENALDFDDLLLVAGKLLQKESIRKFYSEKWKYIHIDEYQDTNKVQYQITEAIARDHQNICVVGDVDQCLVKGTKIKMADGNLKSIENVKKGELVLSNYGSGDFRPAKIIQKKERQFNGEFIKIKTEKGRTLTSTSDHIHFAGYKLGETPQLYFNYLMYKNEFGWRIGTTQVHTRGQRKPVIGFIQRSNQEHADATWIIATHQTSNEARIQEYIFSLKYQIPTLPFVPRKGLSIGGYIHDKNSLKKIFSSFDTEKSALKLLADIGLSRDYPHHYPQVRNANRRNVNIT